MSLSLYFLAALFLPLFPLSMGFGMGFARLRSPVARALLLLLWPQFGVLLIAQAGAAPPPWFAAWALVTAALYAFRAIALREAGLWIGFIATSAWALLWLDPGPSALAHLRALSFSAPLALLALITGDIERRFGAAHTRLELGLASVAPRHAGVFAVAMLAAIATPVFPNFFTMLATFTARLETPAGNAAMVVAALAMIWVLWSWSGARLLQGLVVGDGGNHAPGHASGQVSGMGHGAGGGDLTTSRVWAYGVSLGLLAIAGLGLAGVLL